MFSFIIFSIFSLLVKIHANDSGITELKIDQLTVKKFPIMENAVLNCSSISKNHNFYCWYHLDSDTIIGPYNEDDFDFTKYGYEVLSGNLTIRTITEKEAGLYSCISRGIDNDGVRITSVKVLTVGYNKDPESEANSLRLILAILSSVLFCSIVFVAYRIWKDRFVHPRYLDNLEDDDEENSAEEIYRAPGTSGIIKQSIVKEKPKDYESPLVSTDFHGILDSRI
ncbi:hypothetical protein WA026_018113 [Henosepilachna vigintioctopunctata]|uniref:Immunoglobulin subtype domain-containing protein n=1 Tax=Henosepilachna vigintioctopunctata TaxID=420089 RepID=A0AAW1UMA2_9CUCU